MSAHTPGPWKLHGKFSVVGVDLSDLVDVIVSDLSEAAMLLDNMEIKIP